MRLTVKDLLEYKILKGTILYLHTLARYYLVAYCGWLLKVLLSKRVSRNPKNFPLYALED